MPSSEEKEAIPGDSPSFPLKKANPNIRPIDNAARVIWMLLKRSLKCYDLFHLESSARLV